MRTERAMTALYGSLLTGALLLTAGVAHAVDVERVVSPGGIEAWLIQNDATPVISMTFAFRGGSAQDPEGAEGTANLLSIMLDEGAGDLDAETFQQRLSDRAIQLRFSAGSDTFTGSLRTVTDYADEAFELLRLALNEPVFAEDSLERMRAAVLADIRRQVVDPAWLSRRAFYDVALPGHPYARPSRGTAATLSNLTAEDLEAYVEAVFAQDNLIVGVAGDISAEELADALDGVFGDLPPQASLAPIPAAEFETDETVLVEWQGPQSIVFMAQPGISRDDPDYYPAIVMNHILGGGGFSSRLMNLLREERGLTYGVYSGLSHFEHGDLITVSAEVSNPNVAEAVTVIEAQWEEMAREGPTASELENAIRYLTGSFPLGFTSTRNLAEVLVVMQRDGLGVDWLDRRNDFVAAVSHDDVRRVASRLLDPEDFVTVIVGAPPEEAIDPDIVLDAENLAARELAAES